jgi:hypothetical protein
MSSYLVAMAVGDFRVSRGSADGAGSRLRHREEGLGRIALDSTADPDVL